MGRAGTNVWKKKVVEESVWYTWYTTYMLCSVFNDLGVCSTWCSTHSAARGVAHTGHTVCVHTHDSPSKYKHNFD